jgi:release factor glutamine methyltransferase
MDWMTNHFKAKGVDSPRVCAEMLLAHVLKCERLQLYTDVDRPASEAERQQLRDLTQRAADHEPVQYLVGHAWFFSRKFEVSPATLIPRPSTETLVEHVLQRERAEPRGHHPLIADIGTGTGCIAISLAAALRDARIVATDIAPQALELAARNATAHGVADRVDLHAGDGLAPLREVPGSPRFDYICSNPPYVPDAEWEEVDRNVREYEPERALRGGADGLDVIRRLIGEAPPLLQPGGQLVVEIAHAQREAVLSLALEAGFASARVVKDYESYWRVLIADVAETK